MIGLIALLFALFTRRIIWGSGPASVAAHRWLGGTSAACLLAAGIGRLDHSIRTWGGVSSAERLNDWIFWMLSFLGTVCVLLVIQLP